MIRFDKDNPSEIPTIPTDVAVCPICNAPLVIDDIDEWETKTGRVTETGLHIECSTAPAIGSSRWERWFGWHYAMPYVDWLPVDDKVFRWFDKNYRLRLPNNRLKADRAGMQAKAGQPQETRPAA